MSSKGKVLLAMSGGVDSSVAAALLKDEGYEVVGAFMRLGSPGETLDELVPAGEACSASAPKIHKQGCCSVGDAADARLVAAELDIPLYVLNFRKDFRRVIDYFVDEYARGRTPNPCVRCNDWLKFGRLHDHAEHIGADFVASGHYARIGEIGGKRTLLRGKDTSKDQSYVLFGIPSKQLASTLLPIGDYETKQEVRDLAHKYGLPVFNKPDSQEICFVPDNDYASFVERERPDLIHASGEIRDKDGNVLGEHDGQHRFTIGQRRKVGIALGYPIYVVDKDPETNTVTIGSEEDLLATECEVAEANWLVDGEVGLDWTNCSARHRYNGEAAPAKFRRTLGSSGRFDVIFDEPQRAVTPGQALVVYDSAEPDRVLGGGWIASIR
ncbi:MAG: tRNA 2-thiouridine(34) synthase MnmA [Phycisphaerales bacterium]